MTHDTPDATSEGDVKVAGIEDGEDTSLVIVTAGVLLLHVLVLLLLMLGILPVGGAFVKVTVGAGVGGVTVKEGVPTDEDGTDGGGDEGNRTAGEVARTLSCFGTLSASDLTLVGETVVTVAVEVTLIGVAILDVVVIGLAMVVAVTDIVVVVVADDETMGVLVLVTVVITAVLLLLKDVVSDGDNAVDEMEMTDVLRGRSCLMVTYSANSAPNVSDSVRHTSSWDAGVHSQGSKSLS